MFKNFRVALTAMLTVAALGACSNDNLTNPGNGSATRFALESVNGNSLPYTFGQGGSTVSIQGDTYTLYTDNTYSEVTNETVSNGYQATNVQESESGNWYQNNTAVTFTPTSSTRNSFSSYTGSLSGGGLLGGGSALTITANGTVSVYSQQ